MSCVTSSDRARLRGERVRQPLLQLRARDRVERRERLVQQQHGPRGEQRARERDALAHAARQLVRARGGELRRARSARTARRPAAAPRAARRRRSSSASAGVVERRAPRQQQVALRHQDAARKPVGGRRAALHGDLPGRRLLQARRRSRAAWTCRSRRGRRARAPRRRRPASDTSSQRRHRPAAGRERLRQPGDRHGRLGRRGACHQRLPLGSPHGHRAACSLRGDYPTGSKGQRRECRWPSGAISARLPASPPGGLGAESIGGPAAPRRARPKFSIRTMRPVTERPHLEEQVLCIGAAHARPGRCPRTAAK